MWSKSWLSHGDRRYCRASPEASHARMTPQGATRPAYTIHCIRVSAARVLDRGVNIVPTSCLFRMARTMPNAPSVPMAPHPFRDFTDLLEDVVMSRRHRAERRPGEFMADRSGNGRRRRSGLRLAWPADPGGAGRAGAERGGSVP